jgi:hypothetical protein
MSLEPLLAVSYETKRIVEPRLHPPLNVDAGRTVTHALRSLCFMTSCCQQFLL